MKPFATLIAIVILCSCSHSQSVSYTGSTPANAEVRRFLNISMTDSIDFIRWKVVLRDNTYELNCSYGLCLPGTSGFREDQRVMIKSMLVKKAPFIQLQNDKRSIYLLIVNSNLLHFVNADKQLLIGNGGWSYALNNVQPDPAANAQFTLPYTVSAPAPIMTFIGRTPCHPLAEMLQLNKSDACNKMKWHLVLYTDSLTGQPTHYAKGSRREREDPSLWGKWAIKKGKKGETIYVLNPEKGDAATYLLKASDTILYVTDAKGSLLMGNEDFSWVLNGAVENP
ncbi:MAG TPA: hypothetical protein VHM26_19045 [Chitinophagaceae bacterium]|jgi:hypothetical protein|nr:hypothetical protein [Chitinophagaceae bacterium]